MSYVECKSKIIFYNYLYVCFLVITFLVLGKGNAYAFEKDHFFKEDEIEDEAFPQGSMLKRKKSFAYPIAICAIFQNEESYLREWIEFHKLVGVSHFYLYNNLSTDNFREVLQPYIESKEVDLIDWPHQSTSPEHWTEIQTKAYEDAVRRCIHRARWLAILDTDEFLVPVEKDNLIDFLKPYEGYGAIAVNWQMYGTSGVAKVHADELMIEQLVLKAPSDYSENMMIKSIVNPVAVASIIDPHFVNLRKGYGMVDSNFNALNNSSSPNILLDKIRVNHYWCRDEWFFENFKCARRQNWLEGYDGQLRRRDALNQVEDAIMFRFVPELKRRMGLSP